jgi:DoxX-like family
MQLTFTLVVLLAIVVNGFSGVAALAHFGPIKPGMAAVGVPVTWLRFPIGTLKVLGAIGLVTGLWVPVLGAAAAAGLVVYFACAIQTHLLARDHGFQFGLAIFLLAMNAGVLAVLLSRTA